MKATKYSIPAQGTIDYRYVTIPTGLKEDRWVAKAEVHAGARGAVHHILVFCKYPENRKSEEPAIDGGLEAGYFASLVPGERPNEWPADAGKLLPAGSSLMFQMHYTANGTPTEDVSEIGFVFHKTPPKKTVKTRGITQRKLQIDPNEADAEFTSAWRVPGTSRCSRSCPICISVGSRSSTSCRATANPRKRSSRSHATISLGKPAIAASSRSRSRRTPRSDVWRATTTRRRTPRTPTPILP